MVSNFGALGPKMRFLAATEPGPWNTSIAAVLPGLRLGVIANSLHFCSSRPQRWAAFRSRASAWGSAKQKTLSSIQVGPINPTVIVQDGCSVVHGSRELRSPSSAGTLSMRPASWNSASRSCRRRAQRKLKMRSAQLSPGRVPRRVLQRSSCPWSEKCVSACSDLTIICICLESPALARACSSSKCRYKAWSKSSPMPKRWPILAIVSSQAGPPIANSRTMR